MIICRCLVAHYAPNVKVMCANRFDFLVSLTTTLMHTSAKFGRGENESMIQTKRNGNAGVLGHICAN